MSDTTALVEHFPQKPENVSHKFLDKYLHPFRVCPVSSEIDGDTAENLDWSHSVGYRREIGTSRNG